jgi:hypothetical protein
MNDSLREAALMRLTFRRATGASVLLLGLLTACASTGDATIDADGGVAGDDSGVGADVGSTHDSATNHFDSGSGGDTGGGMVCMANCTQDSDCQNSCPPAPNNGVNCCDVGSGVCFASSSSTCPMSGGDAGMD